jgi:hypothetical protein
MRQWQVSLDGPKEESSSALIRCPQNLILSVKFGCKKISKNMYEMLEYIIEDEKKGWKKRTKSLNLWTKISIKMLKSLNNLTKAISWY